MEEMPTKWFYMRMQQKNSSKSLYQCYVVVNQWPNHVLLLVLFWKIVEFRVLHHLLTTGTGMSNFDFLSNMLLKESSFVSYLLYMQV